jgi:molybdopterin converting factor small subunit
MPRITVELPSMLAAIAGGARTVCLDAASLRGALEGLLEARPALRVHLFDESGRMRPHVLCFHNGTNSRWMDSMDVPLREGDVITILQAVSGG